MIKISGPIHVHLPGTVMDYDIDRNTKASFKNSIGHLIRETPSKVVMVPQRIPVDHKTGRQYTTVRMTV